jgi:hypothetical protein
LIVSGTAIVGKAEVADIVCTPAPAMLKLIASAVP